VKTISNKVKASIGLSICAKIISGERPILHENMSETDPFPFQNANFQLIFTCSASAVTPAKKGVHYALSSPKTGVL